ncbi:MAG: DUF4382 domain-containing protein [Longimicrobiales bacterium]
MFRKYSRFLPLTALLLGVAACDDSTTSPDLNAGERGFTLLLTDAPGDFHAAVVTISEINLHGSGGDVVLLDDPFTVDLLDLRNEVATIVDDIELPEGDYSELRLVLDGAYIEVEDESGGTTIYASSPDYEGLPIGVSADGDLQMPSMDQSGLKVKLPENLDVDEGDVVVMIDFDVAESFGHQAGNSGKWVMHPVIRATDVTFGGNLLARLQLGDGVVLPELAGVLLTLADFDVQLVPVGGGSARTGVLSDTDGDGIFEFMFKGLVPGQYALAFVAPGGLLVTFSPVLPLTVDVFERETTTETVTLSAATLASSIVATLQLADGVTLPVVNETAVTLADFDAELTPAGGEPSAIAFTDADDDGIFEATFADLVAGEYSLTVISPAGVTATYDVTVPVPITLGAGATETRAIVVTGATTP